MLFCSIRKKIMKFFMATGYFEPPQSAVSILSIHILCQFQSGRFVFRLGHEVDESDVEADEQDEGRQSLSELFVISFVFQGIDFLGECIAHGRGKCCAGSYSTEILEQKNPENQNQIYFCSSTSNT